MNRIVLKFTIIVFICAFLSEDAISFFEDTHPGLSLQAQELIDSADEAYRESNFEAAISMYESYLKQYNNNSDVWFNLGNAYYRTGRFGKSIFCYHKAIQSNQMNDDAKKNLEFVRRRRVDKIETEENNNFYKIISAAKNNSSRLFILFNWLIAFSIILAVFTNKKKISRFIGGISILCLLFVSLLLYETLIDEKKNLYVIIYPKADVYSAPREGVPVLTVHDGLEIEVRRIENDFAELSLSGSTLGWVKIKTLSERI